MLYHSERLAPTINEQQREAEDLAIQKECLKEYLKEIAQDLLETNPSLLETFPEIIATGDSDWVDAEYFLYWYEENKDYGFDGGYLCRGRENEVNYPLIAEACQRLIAYFESVN